MKFFNRTREIAKLREIEAVSQTAAQFTVITGRRRIGKTSLVREAYKETEYLYFFVVRKSEADLCRTYMHEVREKLSIPLPDGKVNSFANLFRFLMELATTRHLTLFIDEFQDFFRVNPSVFSEMQNIWDSYKEKAKINLIVAGSVNTLMNRIFKDEKEPLFGRQTSMITVKPFTPSVVKQIMEYYSPGYQKSDLLALWALTGGVAKYLELFVGKGCYNQQSMLHYVLDSDSYFITEGKNLLVEEFGKDYGIYFSILTAISQGKNTRAEIEDAAGVTEVSGYLRNLAEEYGLISKRQPLFEKSVNRNVKYIINDQFLRFWFRFIYKFGHIIEAGGYERLRQIVERDFSTFTGFSLECWFAEAFLEKGLYTRLGYWHDRYGNNEIDFIAEDSLEKRLEIYEVKRNEKNIDISILRAKTSHFLDTVKRYDDYELILGGLSIKDM